MSRDDLQADPGHGLSEVQDAPRLLHLLNQFSVGMTAVVDSAMGTDYANNPEILCVVSLCRSGSRTFGELMALSHLPRRSVANLVKLLERSDVVTSGPSPDDRRATLVQLTATGQQRCEIMRQELDDFFEESRNLAKEIVDLLAPAGVEPSVALRPTSGMEILRSTAKAGVEMVAAVEFRTSDRAVWGRKQVALLEIYADGSARPGRLADSIGVTSGGLTYVVDQLEEDGLVERIYGSDESDRRAVDIVLTRSGQRLASDTIEGFQDVAPRLVHLFAAIRDRVARQNRSVPKVSW